jgi:zinc protease
MIRRALLLAAVFGCSGGNKPGPTTPTPTGGGPTPTEVGQNTQTPPTPVNAKATKVRTVEGITEYTLENGMQVLVFPDQTQSTVTVNITYLVGSRVEGYGETGMAHLLEHMMFKGTSKYRNVLKVLEEKGAQLNGTTWTDRTNYYETLPATPENLEFALDLEADRMRNALISPDDLKTEFSVVRNEFEMGENDPLGVLQERIVSTAFLWHNYGKSTIGSRADIERVPVPALRAFYEKYYQPDNSILVVSGKFDEATALKAIEAKFGVLPRPKRVLQPSYTVEPQQDGERNVMLRRNGDIHAVGLAYHTPGVASPEYAGVLAAIDVLTREPSGRLYKKLVETKLASSVGGFNLQFRDPYLAYFQAEIRDAKNVDKVEKIMLDEIEKLGASKIDDKEILRFRAAQIKELELAMADSQRIAVELSEFAALGDWRALFAYRDAVSKVTAADAQKAAQMFFKQTNRTAGRFVPTKSVDRSPLIETPDVIAYVKGIEGGEVKEAGEQFTATLDNIEAKTTRKELKGGIKAALLPKKTRGGKVTLQLALHWGDEKSLQNKQIVADLASDLLPRGTTKKSYQDLQDLQDQLKSKIWIGGGADGFILNIETLRDHLAGALDLSAEMMTSPSFDAKQFDIVKQEKLAALEQQLTDPQAIAFTALQQITSPWPKTDPRYTMSAQEQIDAIKKTSLADVKAFYKEFAGVGKGELAVVGDFDATAIPAQVEKLFGGWTSKKKYERLKDKPFGVAGTSKTIDVKDKEMTLLVAAHDLAMKDDNPDFAAWLIVGQLLGGDAGSRLWMRLREKEGVSYGAWAWTEANPFDESGGVVAGAIVAPANLAKAKASMLEEINKLTNGKITPEELQRTRDSWTKSQDTSLSDDGAVVGMLRNQLYRGRTTEWTKALRAKVSGLAPADVERVAKKYLEPKKLVIIDAGDVAKQGPQPQTNR